MITDGTPLLIYQKEDTSNGTFEILRFTRREQRYCCDVDLSKLTDQQEQRFSTKQKEAVISDTKRWHRYHQFVINGEHRPVWLLDEEPIVIFSKTACVNYAVRKKFRSASKFCGLMKVTTHNFQKFVDELDDQNWVFLKRKTMFIDLLDIHLNIPPIGLGFKWDRLTKKYYKINEAQPVKHLFVRT